MPCDVRKQVGGTKSAYLAEITEMCLDVDGVRTCPYQTLRRLRYLAPTVRNLQSLGLRPLVNSWGAILSIAEANHIDVNADVVLGLVGMGMSVVGCKEA